MQLGTSEINTLGHLEIGGCDLVSLADEFGTPLWIFDEQLIRDNCRELSEAFESYYPNGQVVYSAKAFLTLAMVKLLKQEGLGIEVVSGGELYTALKADFPPEEIYFTGNNKSRDELELAIESGIGRIIIDNFYEIEQLQTLTTGHPDEVNVLLRVTPGVEAHTHHYIQTGQEDSKFGFDLSSGQAERAVATVLNTDGLSLTGLHCHIGSQIFDLEPFAITAEKMVGFLAELQARFGVELEELDFGGGIGVRYVPDDDPPPLSAYVKTLADAVTQAAKQQNLSLPKITIEPGRAIINEAGTTLYRMGPRKEIDGLRTYVMADGGMTDNPRPSLYDAVYTAIVANKADQKPGETVTIAGKCCESGDILIEEAELPTLEPGDLLAVRSTGAYNYSMSGNYNMLPRPAGVFVMNGQADLILRRENYEDLIRNHTIPTRLES